MSRSADYTIKGFLYQFNKTLLEILRADKDSVITVEGIIEDIEVATPVAVTAIQCKYHEAAVTFTPSAIYKPLVQMMHHFHSHPSANIRYVLYAHFPCATGETIPAIGPTEFAAALESDNSELQKYIEPIRGHVDLAAFEKMFTMDFGPSFDELVGQVESELKANGIPEDDIDTLAYPNAINIIADISVIHDHTKRCTSKRQLVECLLAIRKTAISRWTLALRTRKTILEARRRQLKVHFDKNSRLRYFLVDAAGLEDYSEEIVLFICDYLDKYHFKQAHISTPVLCLCTTQEDFDNIRYRLFTKGIIVSDGYIGDHFDESRFFREPMVRKGEGGAIVREFSIRLLHWDSNGPLLNNRKCDDLLLLGNPRCDSLNRTDVNVEHLAASSLKEIKYLMGVSNAYE